MTEAGVLVLIALCATLVISFTCYFAYQYATNKNAALDVQDLSERVAVLDVQVNGCGGDECGDPRCGTDAEFENEFDDEPKTRVPDLERHALHGRRHGPEQAVRRVGGAGAGEAVRALIMWLFTEICTRCEARQVRKESGGE